MKTGYRRKKDLEKDRQSLCDLCDKSKWSNMNVIKVQEGGEAGKKKNGEMNAKFPSNWASLVAQMVKNLPAMQETWV